MEAVVLVGGLGTRLRNELGDLPKALVQVGGRPFLEHLLLHLAAFNIREIVLAVSYRRESIQQQLGDGAHIGIQIRYGAEQSPLGTAGALRNVLPLVAGDNFLVLNGDSFMDVNFEELVRFHMAHHGALTITAVYKRDCRDYGRLEVSGNRVLSFVEKNFADASAGYVNAGLYVFSRGLLQNLEAGIVQSLENDLIPDLLESGEPVHAFCTNGYFMDLGTPTRLRAVREDFRRHSIPLRSIIQ